MRPINRFMQHGVWAYIGAAGLILVMILQAQVSLAATPSQSGVSWNYKLLGPLNSAQDPETGLTILISGSGSFDTSKGNIDGGGIQWVAARHDGEDGSGILSGAAEYPHGIQG